MYEDITYTSRDGIATVTLNRPDCLNALRFQTYEELDSAMSRAGRDPTVGAVILQGAGRAFCAGGDLDMARDDLKDEHAGRAHYFTRMIRLSQTMQMLDVPIVAAVQGPCVGGGAELALFADFIFVSDTTFFYFNGTAIGGCSWWGAPQLLPLYVGLRRAEQMLLLAERVSGEEAVRLGLANAIFSSDALAGEVRDVAQRLLDLSEDGLRLTKASLRSLKENLLSSMSAAAEMNVAVIGNSDLHAAFDAVRRGGKMSWRELRTQAHEESDGD